MMNIGEHGEGLLVESFWKLKTAARDEFFVVCSGRTFSLNEPYDVPEIAALPEGAEMLIPRSRSGRQSEDIDRSVPTANMFDRVSYIGSFTGDDRTILLTNGGLIVYELESNPQAIFDNKPEEFVSRPVMNFFDPEEVKKWVAKYPRECCTELLTVRMRQDSQ